MPRDEVINGFNVWSEMINRPTLPNIWLLPQRKGFLRWDCWLSLYYIYLLVYLFITFVGNQANPNSTNALNLRNASMKCMETDLFKRSSFRCRRETRGPGENLRKQVWTANQMHIRRRDWESNPDPLMHSAREEPLRYLLPSIYWSSLNRGNCEGFLYLRVKVIPPTRAHRYQSVHHAYGMHCVCCICTALSYKCTRKLLFINSQCKQAYQFGDDST